MLNLTQNQIDDKAKDIKKAIKDSSDNFLKKNYLILKRKRKNTRLECILISDCELNTLVFKAPEEIELYIDTVCFYMALDHYNIPDYRW
jgi:hypothetical protein